MESFTDFRFVKFEFISHSSVQIVNGIISLRNQHRQQIKGDGYARNDNKKKIIQIFLKLMLSFDVVNILFILIFPLLFEK